MPLLEGRSQQLLGCKSVLSPLIILYYSVPSSRLYHNHYGLISRSHTNLLHYIRHDNSRPFVSMKNFHLLHLYRTHFQINQSGHRSASENVTKYPSSASVAADSTFFPLYAPLPLFLSSLSSDTTLVNISNEEVGRLVWQDEAQESAIPQVLWNLQSTFTDFLDRVRRAELMRQDFKATTSSDNVTIVGSEATSLAVTTIGHPCHSPPISSRSGTRNCQLSSYSHQGNVSPTLISAVLQKRIYRPCGGISRCVPKFWAISMLSSLTMNLSPVQIAAAMIQARIDRYYNCSWDPRNHRTP